MNYRYDSSILLFLFLILCMSCESRERRRSPSANPDFNSQTDLTELEEAMHDLDSEVAQVMERYPDAYFVFPPADQEAQLDRSPETIRDYDPNKKFDPHIRGEQEEKGVKTESQEEKENQIEIHGVRDEKDRRVLEVTLERIQVNRQKLGGRRDSHGVYYIVDTDPQPQEGFDQFRQEIARNLKIPHQAIEDGIEGDILFSFVVDKNGAVENVRLVQTKLNKNPEGNYMEDMFDQVKSAIMETSGHWQPGIYEGEKVVTRYYLPIHFDAAEGVISAREHIH